ncbi:MAG: 2-C-methyl-D-erythritol 4-phosphate cytidylyltransferase [Pseudomonadota bacterium]
MKVGAIIVAAGRGIRAGGGVPKQWRPLAGKTVAAYALEAFATHPSISQTVLVVHEDDVDGGFWPRELVTDVVVGGAIRSASVRAGLAALAADIGIVLIHDAARPCVTRAIIDAVLRALETEHAAAPAIPVVDALWTGKDGRVTGTADRSNLYRAQTPQGFWRSDIENAHADHQDGAADDVEIARRAGLEVAITPGHDDNLKITGPEDFARAEAVLRARNGH